MLPAPSSGAAPVRAFRVAAGPPTRGSPTPAAAPPRTPEPRRASVGGLPAAGGRGERRQRRAHRPPSGARAALAGPRRRPVARARACRSPQEGGVRPEARGGGRHGDPLGPGPAPGASGAALTALLPGPAGWRTCRLRRSAASASPPSPGRAAAWARRRRRRPVEWAVRAQV